MAVIITALALFIMVYPVPVRGHSWYPPRCCSGFDCRPIIAEDVLITPAGFVIKENGETIAFSPSTTSASRRPRRKALRSITAARTAQGKTICLYIPNWGN